MKVEIVKTQRLLEGKDENLSKITSSVTAGVCWEINISLPFPPRGYQIGNNKILGKERIKYLPFSM